MNKGIKLTIFLACLLFTASPLVAQSADGSSNGLIYGLVIVGAFLLLWAIIAITDNLMQIEATKAGIGTEEENMSLFPKMRDVISKKAPSYAKNEHFVRLKKGFNIKLDGAANSELVSDADVTRFAISPYDFRGLAPIPKIEVVPGQEVQAGDVLFYDKTNPDVKFVAPVSGEIIDVERGAKRSISKISILADKDQKKRKTDLPSLEGISREDLVALMASAGTWTLLNQRPFDIIPALDEIPRDIFISTFDTAPLAPNSSLIIKGNEAAFQKAIEVLGHLTEGKVHVGLNAKSKRPDPAYTNLTGATKHYFSGPHPSGNVGVQIHHVKPIGINDRVWTLKLQDAITLGRFFLTGEYDTSRIVVLSGAELKEAKYVRTHQGANIGELLKSNIAGEKVRVVAGDVLSGSQTDLESYLPYREDQITVIEEGDYYEALGWLVPISPRPSISKTFPSFLYPNYKHRANTNTHGEERAFVVTGQYEKMLPMDIYPQFLMKSIMMEDIEKMEGLGITELSEEDVALCEFACTSKAPLQKILRDGLDMLRSQL